MSEAPREQRRTGALDRIVVEGVPRLHRDPVDLLAEDRQRARGE